MLKTTRRAAVAVLLTAAAWVAPFEVDAQGQPAAPAASAPAAPAAPAAAPVAPVAPKAAAKGANGKGTEIVENPYGLDAIWRGSDWVAKATLIILFVMSLGTWYIIITKIYEQAKLGAQARLASKSFWTAPSVREGISGLKEGSAFRFLAESGLEATKKHTGLLGNINLSDWVSANLQRAIDNVGSRLQDGLAFLATVGSTAPFVGLFGTVWGIYHALTAIGIAGQASIDKVAGPVGEALIMTAIGLAVAVPAVLGYNWLIRRNKRAMDEIRSFGADLHAVLMSTPQATAKA